MLWVLQVPICSAAGLMKPNNKADFAKGYNHYAHRTDNPSALSMKMLISFCLAVGGLELVLITREIACQVELNLLSLSVNGDSR